MLTAHTRPTQKQRLLKILKARGKYGAYNYELNEHVGFRYGARVYELRAEGYNILTQRVKPGVFRHILLEEKEYTNE